MVTLGPAALAPFSRFTRYNSPYIAHREGRAIDLYPGTEAAPSPVGGEVLETHSLRAPSRPYAEDRDHLIVIDTGERLARLLHVDPTVEPGERIAAGDVVGRLVRSGYFAPWVDNHVHLGFRSYDADPVRASGSLELDVAVPVTGVSWDGTGTVVEAGDTYAVLDEPGHPQPGESFVGITDDTGRFVLDGGLPHYKNGGVIPLPMRADVAGISTPSTPVEPSPATAPGTRASTATSDPITFLGTTLGPADGADLPWADVTVTANGSPITGLSLFLGRETIAAKLICPEVPLDVGESVAVSLSSR